jgi:diguanylate cyclase (GGDEF)-like protein
VPEQGLEGLLASQVASEVLLEARPEDEGEAAAPSSLLAGLTQALKPSPAPLLWTRQGLASLVAVGGLLAGCAVGALALGPAGLLVTMAVEAVAFAGGMLLTIAGQQELADANRRLQYAAQHDPLTGLKNRGAIMALLEQEVGQWGGRRRHLGLALADVDHFKRINDTWGHLAGDAVLAEVARRISGALRQEDAVGRYGGEEMLILLPGLGTAEALRTAERIRLEICSRPIHTPEGSLQVSASFGVASTEDLLTPTAFALIHLADQALYRAKERGRNRVEAARLR